MIRTVGFGVVLVLSTLFFSLVGMGGGLLLARRGLFDWVHRNWARSLLWAAGARVEAAGLERLRPATPYVFVSNHQSFVDVWTMMATLPASLRFVAKQELSRIPLFAAATRAAGHVFIDRRDPAAASRAIRRSAERMRSEGLSLVFFAEGTRSSDGSLGRFKKGVFTLAIETQAELVPVAVDGGGRIMGRGERRVRPGRVRLRCGRPVRLRGMKLEDRDQLLADTQAAVAGMLSELRGATAPLES